MKYQTPVPRPRFGSYDNLNDTPRPLPLQPRNSAFERDFGDVMLGRTPPISLGAQEQRREYLTCTNEKFKEDYLAFQEWAIKYYESEMAEFVQVFNKYWRNRKHDDSMLLKNEKGELWKLPKDQRHHPRDDQHGLNGKLI